MSATEWATAVTAGSRSLLRRWRALPPLAQDVIATVVLALIVFSPWSAALGTRFGKLEPRPWDTIGYVLEAGLWLPLVVRRRWPAVTLALIACAFAGHELLGYPETAASMGLYAAVYSAGAHQARSRRELLVVASGGYLGVVLALALAGTPQGPSDFLVFYVVLAACWGAGAWVWARQQSEEERRRSGARLAAVDERARIAQELHDVVTHHVTTMVNQADAAQVLVPEGSELLGTGLGGISDTGRRALGDLRHLLGVLTPADGSADGSAESRADGSGDARGGGGQAEPAPGVGGIRDLVEQARRTGQPVELAEEGLPPSTDGGAQVAAYRVVQEALTNAITHAPGRPTVVRMRYGAGETELEVITEGPDGTRASGRRAAAVGSGRGISGMQQRLSLFGGELVTGPTSGGGFQVRAWIPDDGDA